MRELEMLELIEEADGMERCLEQVERYEQAVDIADELELQESAFDIRLKLMSAAEFTGATEKLLTAFSWCLGRSDQDPDQFPEANLLWRYKWAIAVSYRFPEIKLDQIRSMLDDFELRLKRNHCSPRPANYLRMCFYTEVGELDAAAKYAEVWPTQPRDWLADCRACELDNQVDVHFLMGDDDKAMQKAEPLLQRTFSCTDVPHRTLARMVLCALRLGKLELAENYNRQGYPLVAQGTEFLPQNAKHAIYFARTGHFEEGLKIVERHLPWSLQTKEARDRLDFFLGVIATLRAVDLDPVKLRLPPTHPLYNRSQQYPRRELLDWFEQQKTQLCDRFDQRNQNDWQSRLAESWLQLAEAS